MGELSYKKLPFVGKAASKKHLGRRRNSIARELTRNLVGKKSTWKDHHQKGGNIILGWLQLNTPRNGEKGRVGGEESGQQKRCSN